MSFVTMWLLSGIGDCYRDLVIVKVVVFWMMLEARKIASDRAKVQVRDTSPSLVSDSFPAEGFLAMLKYTMLCANSELNNNTHKHKSVSNEH